MGIENKPYNPETKQEKNPLYEFKSKRGDEIISAVDKAVEHQKKFQTWSDEAENPTKLALYRIFDTLTEFNQNNLQEITDVQLKTAVQVMTGSYVGKEFKKINDRLKNNYGARFNFQYPLNNTMYVLQTDVENVEEYFALRNERPYKEDKLFGR